MVVRLLRPVQSQEHIHGYPWFGRQTSLIYRRWQRPKLCREPRKNAKIQLMSLLDQSAFPHDVGYVRGFMYLYVFLWIDQCGPQVSPKIISNLVLSDEDVRYRLVHLRSTAARPSSWPCHILPELQPLQPQESGRTEASVANRWLAGHWKEGPVIVENRRSQKMREWSPKHVLRPSGTSLHTLSYVSFRVCLGLMISFFKEWVVDYRMLEMLDTPVAQICVRAPSTWQKLSDPSLMCQKLLHSMDKQWRFFSSSGEQPGVCWLSAQVLKLNIKHSILIYYINIICVYIYMYIYIYIHT